MNVDRIMLCGTNGYIFLYIDDGYLMADFNNGLDSLVCMLEDDMEIIRLSDWVVAKLEAGAKTPEQMIRESVALLRSSQ